MKQALIERKRNTSKSSALKENIQDNNYTRNFNHTSNFQSYQW